MILYRGEAKQKHAIISELQKRMIRISRVGVVIIILLTLIECGKKTPITSPDSTGPLQVQASANTTRGEAVLSVSFSAVVSGGIPPYRYAWDFDDSDGLQVDNYRRDPTFVYALSGSYTVTLIVTDAMGSSGKDTLSIRVEPPTHVSSDYIALNGVHGTAENPYIIEGLAISTSKGNGISLNNCSYIVIRNNYIHHVTDPSDEGIKGNAIYVQNSSHIYIQGNHLTNNKKAMCIFATPGSEPITDIRVSYNVVTNTTMNHGILLKNANNVEISNNYLRDNGDPQYFEHGRITGIIIWDFSDAQIHDNISINSSSDGIGAATSKERYEEDPTFISRNIDIYNNTSRGNGEQGIWLQHVQGGNIYNNYLEKNRIRGNSGIMLGWNVSHMKIYRNVIFDNEIAGISINESFDNEIYENIIHEPHAAWGGIWVAEFETEDWISPIPTENNRIRNNIIYGSSTGLYIEHGRSTQIINNTIYKNGPFHTEVGGIDIGKNATLTLIKNNIIVENSGIGIRCSNSSTEITYNDIWNNTTDYQGCRIGAGNISADPEFVDPDNGNFRLQSSSPCIDAGDPSSDYTHEPEPNGGRIDMGAY